MEITSDTHDMNWTSRLKTSWITELRLQ